MKRVLVFAFALAIALSAATAAFGVNGSGGAGLEFGQHHSEHARVNDGFTGAENPGTHRGFAGWNGD